MLGTCRTINNAFEPGLPCQIASNVVDRYLRDPLDRRMSALTYDNFPFVLRGLAEMHIIVVTSLRRAP